MGRMELYYKVLKCFVFGNTVKPEDIGNSYDLVSSGYNERFLGTMNKYNAAMLSLLRLPDRAKVLDLACGTGFNSEWLLNVKPDYEVDAVDISAGMLEQANRRLGGRARLFNTTMLDFLKGCSSEQYNLIVCSWALKYQPPLKILKECRRVLKPGGQMGVILNSRETLPEFRRVYKYLLMEYSKKINKLMFELPNPRDEKHLGKWLERAGFGGIHTYRGIQKFVFNDAAEMADWITSTGALAGFDRMLDLHEEMIKGKIAGLFNDFEISTITHDFVWGAAKKC